MKEITLRLKMEIKGFKKVHELLFKRPNIEEEVNKIVLRMI